MGDKSEQENSAVVDGGQSPNPSLDDPETASRLNDPAPAYSVFTTWQKRSLVLASALAAFFSPLSAQIYLPALNSIAEDLNITDSQVNLTITTYMIFQGIVPMFVGSLADGGGRRPAYLLCFVVYIAANIGIALAPNYGAVLALRCLQSTGSSPTVALCSAVVADIATSAERGTYIGITAVPAVLAPALGPVIGGLLSQYLGWRSIFWFLTILAGVTLVLVALFFPETCRLIVGDGSIPPPPFHQTLWQVIRRSRKKKKQSPTSTTAPQPQFKFKVPNVLESLLMLLQKETGVLLGTASITFAGFYSIAAAIPSQFSKIYGLNEIEVGLMYLPMALGSIVAAAVVGPLLSRNYRRHCAIKGFEFDRKRQMDLAEFPIEKARLEVGIFLIALAGASLVAWGWALEAHAHLSVPIIISCMLCIGMIGFNNAINALLVDIHPGKPGTATAANNFTRCLLGAAMSALIVPMINGIGNGWTFTIMGGLNIVCLPFVWLVMHKGMKWRAELHRKKEDGKGESRRSWLWFKRR